MNAKKILWLIAAVLALALVLLAVFILGGFDICHDFCGNELYNATASSVYATNTAVEKLLEGTHAAQTATAQSPR